MEKLVNRPVLVSIVFILVVIFGVISFQKTPIELKPDENVPRLSIIYSWQEATPELILKEVLIPAEGAIMELKGISNMESAARRGKAEIELEYTRDTDMDFAEVLLKEALNRLQKELPREVERPIIRSDVPDEFERKPLLQVGIYGESIFKLRKIARNEIIPYLNGISGIDSVDLWGGVPPQIKISTDLDTLKKFNVSIWEITQNLSRDFFTKPSISLKREGKEISLSLTRDPGELKNIENIVIKKLGNKKLFLKDIASVFLGYEEIDREIRFNGQSVLTMQVFKEAKKNALKMSKAVRTKLQELANRSEHGISFLIQDDESKELKTELGKLINIVIIILILILLILLMIVRDFKAAFLVFSSVLLSVFATFTVIYLFKMDLNLLTLSGLALGFGIFVDNAVVVFDSILRNREKGMDRKEAAIKGSKDVFLPVMSSTLTTIIVFFSIAFFFQDRLRVYYLPLAYVITLALISSVLISFTLIPTLSSRMDFHLGKRKGHFKTGRFFPFSIKYILVTIIILLGVGYFSGYLFFDKVTMGEFFTWGSSEQLRVALIFKSGTEYEDLKKAIMGFEEVALKKPYKKEVKSRIYSSSNFADMRIEFPPDIENSAYPYQLKQELIAKAANLGGIGVYVTGFDQDNYYYNPNFGSFLPFSITIKGFNYERLMDYCNSVKNDMLKHRRIKQVEIVTDKKMWWGGENEYYKFKINPEKLNRLKMDPRVVYYTIASIIQRESRGNKFRYEGIELSIEVKSSDVDKLELFDLKNMELMSMDGKPYRINELVDISKEKRKGGITRENQEFFAQIKWDYMGSAKSGDRYYNTLYDHLVLPVGFSKNKEEYTQFLTKEEESQLTLALIASAGLIILILGILYNNFFQPWLIFMTIPLALIGVGFGFVIADFSFDSSARVGLILLFGIVVNNAILMVDNINARLKETGRIIDAIVIGTKERIRPIIMTTLTTVIGMLPLVLNTTKSHTEMWSKLALCSVGGLTSSTILMFFILPALYYYFYKFQRNIEGKLQGFKKKT